MFKLRLGLFNLRAKRGGSFFQGGSGGEEGSRSAHPLFPVTDIETRNFLRYWYEDVKNLIHDLLIQKSATSRVSLVTLCVVLI